MVRNAINLALQTLGDLERDANPAEDSAALSQVKSHVISAITELELSKQPKSADSPLAQEGEAVSES